MKTAKLRSARRKRLINNTAVHVVLAVLARKVHMCRLSCRSHLH